MNFQETALKGCFIIDPKIHKDSRGFFFESFSQSKIKEGTGFEFNVKQINYSRSGINTLRGLHYQAVPYAQSKIVSVIKGSANDIAVDIRKGSPTYGKYIKVFLSEENKKMLLIPKGFAHGFVSLASETDFLYLTDEFYAPQSEGGIIFDDPTIKINWEIAIEKASLSDKDKKLPLLENIVNNFIFSQ